MIRPPAKNASGTEKPGTSGYGGHGEAAQDPVAVNGPIFVDWPDPLFALAITGEQRGYLEPCGCAGLDFQKGGIGRRQGLFRQLREKGWQVLPVDLGSQIRRFGRQAEIKFETTIQALEAMEYQAVALGLEDLRQLSAEVLWIQTESFPDLFVAANVKIPDVTSLKPYRVLQAGERKIGVTSVMGSSYLSQLGGSEVEVTPPESALAEIQSELEAEGCDHWVLLAHAPAEETDALAEKFPLFDFVVSTSATVEPEPRPRPVSEQSDTRRIEVGQKGMYVGVLGFFDDAENPVRYQRVPLDSRFELTSEMRTLMADYQEQLKALGYSGLGLQPVSHPRGEHGPLAAQFTGSESCGECHKKAYAKWKNRPNISGLPHAHVLATKTLLELDPARHHDPECISCHVTGWNPQEYYPYETGFTSPEETPLLVGNGCENCHGPGAAHVAAEGGRDEVAKTEHRALMRLNKGWAEENLCRRCHDADNSPGFDFSKYWPLIEHIGKD